MKAWRKCNPTVFLLLQWMTMMMMVVKVMLLWENDICHKNALSLVVLVWCGLQCLCELPEVRKYPASITWTVALLELWMFFMTCRLHSLRGKESMLNLAHFSSLRTIDTLYRETVKCISEVGSRKEGVLASYKNITPLGDWGNSSGEAKQCEILTFFLLKDNKLMRVLSTYIICCRFSLFYCFRIYISFYRLR